MTAVGTAIVVVKTVILLLGGGITYVSFKAYRNTGEPALRVLGIGFGVITLGALLAGIAHQVLSIPLEMGVLINSILVAIGLTIVMYSLYIQRK